MNRAFILLRRAAVMALVVAVVYYVRYYHDDYRREAELREKFADASADPIELAIVWPRHEDPVKPDSFVRGINLAVSKINANGGLRTYVKDAKGKPQEARRDLALRFFDEQSVDAGVAIARYLATETGVTAVIGHDVSAIPASGIYYASGVLFIAPANLDPELTRHGFDNVFSIAPHVNQIALAMVEEVEKIIVKKEIRLGLIYPDGIKAPPDVVVSRLNQASERVNPKLKVNFRVFPLLAYPKPSLLQSQEAAEEQKQLDFKRSLTDFVENSDKYELVLIADVLPDSRVIREQLSKEFESQGKAGTKRILDLNALDWSQAQDFYADFSSGSSTELFDQVVRLVLDEARQDVAIVASRDAHGETLGATIWSSIYDRMDDPVNRLRMELYRSYFPERSSMMLITSEVLAAQPEALFIATGGKEAIELIQLLRNAKYEGVVMCPPGLETQLIPAARSTLGKEAPIPNYLQNTYVVTPFNPNPKGEQTTEKVRQFVASFEQAYREKTDDDKADDKKADGKQIRPDSLAAAGYFSIELLKFAVERGGSAWPKTVGSSMLQFKEKESIFGEVSFTRIRDFQPETTHDLQGLKLYLRDVWLERGGESNGHSPADYNTPDTDGGSDYRSD